MDKMAEYSLLVTIIATLFGIFSLILTYIGYWKFQEADKRVSKAIENKMQEFEFQLEKKLTDISNAQTKLGYAYQAKTPDEALSLLKQAEEIYPKLYNLYNTIGYTYENKNEIYPAIDAFKKAIEMRPEDIAGYNDLARIYAKNQMNEQAIKILEKAIKINRDKLYLSDPVFDELKTEKSYKKILRKVK